MTTARAPCVRLRSTGRGWFIGAGVGARGPRARWRSCCPSFSRSPSTSLIGPLLVVGGVVHGAHAFHVRRWTGAAVRLSSRRSTSSPASSSWSARSRRAGAHPDPERLPLRHRRLAHPGRAPSAPQPGWGWTLVERHPLHPAGRSPVPRMAEHGRLGHRPLVGVDLLFAGWSLIGLAIATRLPARYS